MGQRASLANLVVVELLLRELVGGTLGSVAGLLNDLGLGSRLFFLEGRWALSLVKVGVCGANLLLNALFLFRRALLAIAIRLLTFSM